MRAYKFDYIRLIVILFTLFILFQTLPVHFFADNAEYLYLAKYYSHHPLKIFSVVPFALENRGYIHHLFFYRPMERLFFTVNYIIGKLNPIPYNITQGLLFLILVVSIYNIVHLIANNRVSALLSVTFFLLIPTNYRIVHWLGNSDILSSSLLCLSLYFLFSALKNNSFIHFFLGILVTFFAFLTKVSTAFTLPLLFYTFYLFYRKEYKLNKKLFYISLVYILILMGCDSIFQYIANKDVKTYQYAQYLLYEINPKYILRNINLFYGMFYKSGFYPLLVCCLIITCLRPNKNALFFILWIIFSSLPYLPLHCCSKRYFVYMAIGLCMFLGFVLSHYAKKPKNWSYWIGVILVCIGVMGSIKGLSNNIKRIRYTFELRKTHYIKQKNNMNRLFKLPTNATIYVDDGYTRHFYSYMLSLINRDDIKIELASPDNMVKEFFFEGEVKTVKTDFKPYFTFVDKLGDWRF
ncbi:MAG: glycosyltransferase family 39 protein [Candidatus Omnitrophica bacterium]|nr:glycosyltransferase family 39 protein [Candidatus Omnitrophota bacterium]